LFVYGGYNDRKIHAGKIPRLGGIGFVSSFIFYAISAKKCGFARP
jgi:UDP-N-acetylmuramyl pentapeptide phosphotransferase/UDP-N-acetylglucosamine-1-phosphate transferase